MNNRSPERWMLALCCLTPLLVGCPKNNELPAPSWSTLDSPLEEALDAKQDRGWTATLEAHSIRLGDCLAPNQVVTGKTCVKQPEVVPTEIAPNQLGAGVYLEFLSYLGMESGGETSTTVGDASVKITRDRYQIVRQWARWKEHAYAKADEEVDGPFVDRVRVGVGVRMVFDVVIDRVDTNAKANFGVGQLTAALATGRAKVQVKLSSIGIVDSVLPERSPVVISSPSEYGEVDEAFHRTIKRLSEKVAAMDPARPLKAGILAYHVGTGHEAPSPDPVLYNIGYIWGLRKIAQEELSCAAAADAATWIKNHERSFKDGLTEVYALFTGNPRCDDAAVGTLAIRAAKAELEAWNERERENPAKPSEDE